MGTIPTLKRIGVGMFSCYPGENCDETKTTLGQVQDWFAENGVDYVRAYPSAMLTEETEELFVRAEDNWRLEGWLAQLGWIGTLGHEGGLFIIVGRRI